MASKDIGSIIREMRKASGMSQTRLADKVGVSYQQIQKYEKGSSKLSVPRLLQIADIFGVHFSVFIDEDQAGKASSKVTGSNMTEDEAKVLQLYRRLKRRKLKEYFAGMLADLVRFTESR